MSEVVADRSFRLDGTAGSSVDCAVDWAGPVDLPLADELSVQAACGIMHVHGRKVGTPTPLGVDYASVVARVLAAQGVLAAMVARRRGAGIRGVRTSVAQAALLSVGQYLAAATTGDRWVEPRGTGGPPFVAADGVRFEIETFDAHAWQAFWARVGAPRAAVARGWPPFQLRFATATCPLPRELHAAAGRHGFAALRAAADGARVGIVPVRTGGAAGGPPWWTVPLPVVAAELSTHPGGLPLAGLVVVESTRRLQGPLAGHVLRLLGADVIRIEPPGGDPLRGVPPIAGDTSARFLALNRGKRVVELDLRRDRHAVLDLVAGSDVFVHNMAPGKAAELALTADVLAAVRPGLVYAWASGWHDALGAAAPPGTDYLVQAHSGLGAVLWPPGRPPAPSLMTLTDVLGGLVCAQAVLAGLLARATTGYGQRVESSLLSAAGLLRGAVRRPGGRSAVPVCTDLAALAADHRFAAALEHDGCAFVRTPWEFS
ncbi:CoA transferase [Actinophytocola sp.]|uniref:CoA transferase n=1 Tax=Actinophytocola sp. TaxID=1872138 RepID=UPI003899D052